MTFRRLTFLFFILLFTLNLVHFVGCKLDWVSGHLCAQTYVYILVLIGLYICISVVMAFFIQSGFHHQATCKGNTRERICALTFDDGPDPVVTPKILTVLKREGLTAAFFVIGEKIPGNETLIRRMDGEGHIIGNHSWSHSVWFDFFPHKKMKVELSRTASAIETIINRSPRFFRPPFGVLNPTLSKVLNRLAYQVIGWNVRSYDTLHPDPSKTVGRIIRKLAPGSIILLHDHLPASPQILETLLAELKRNKYQVVPLTQLTQTKAYV